MMAALAVTGCVKAEIAFNSKTLVPRVQPLERLVVLSGVDRTKGFPIDMHFGFESGLRFALASCHVAAELAHGREDIAALSETLRPDAVLVVRPAGGVVRNGVDSKLLFDLDLVDASSAVKVWAARSQLRGMPRRSVNSWEPSMSPKTLCALLLAANVVHLAGCKQRPPTQTTVRSRVLVPQSPPLTRLAVLVKVPKDRNFPIDVQRGFDTAVTTVLAACGVTSRLLYMLPLELIEGERVTRFVNELQPGGTLIVEGPGGTALHESGSSALDLFFRVRLVSSERTRWAAEVTFSAVAEGGRSAADRASGSQLGTRIVVRLGNDGLLPHCPIGIAPPEVPPLRSCAEIVAATHLPKDQWRLLPQCY